MKIVGLISGTSADGIDVALCEITGAPPALEARILHAISHPYPDALQARVLNAIRPGNADTVEVCMLNAALGEQFAAAALAVVASAGIQPDAIDLIGSHGQTVWHQVDEDGSVSSTLQLGEASTIAECTGITTVANFRPRDIAAGGQGAPLTSYADWLLLRAPDHWRAVQNIGGIGNVTFLPPLSDTASAPLAFDTGPGNALMDSAMEQITGGAAHYDRDAALASKGTVDEGWLADLLHHPYYERRPPKTTGRELFSPEMAASLLDAGRARGLADPSILATLAALTVETIAGAYRQFAPGQVREVILGGGGARNPLLVRMLRERLVPAEVKTHEDIGVDSFNKEALVFALLAHETWHHRPGTHPALTGAHHASVLGQITPGANYVDLLRRTWCA